MTRPDLLNELDRRQDELLRQLDELNDRIQSLIRQQTRATPSEREEIAF